MNWRASCLGGRSPLVFTEGNKTAPRYVDNVLDPYGLPCIQEIEDGIFQQDNACPHIENENVKLVSWPSKSPALSVIEHVCDQMGRRLSALEHPSITFSGSKRRFRWLRIPFLKK
ncbi:hypothetical protein Zmor_010930 [Zophobas morio]|uniref:Uncharacterized protein n=1 Tax=Zophobas morio TaxID=2755281 RepID=A0AA38MKF6_9CUCU|nr:hypothetical protein Zmor_010930 [Zophobas morio]